MNVCVKCCLQGPFSAPGPGRCNRNMSLFVLPQSSKNLAFLKIQTLLEITLWSCSCPLKSPSATLTPTQTATVIKRWVSHIHGRSTGTIIISSCTLMRLKSEIPASCAS